MSETDLSRLRIDRQASRPPRRRLSKRWLLGGLAIVLAGGLAVFGRMNAPVAVETVTVGEAWPYQGVTLLNATGYVVAQRKAAVGSKATGRLEWLGVREGSVVKAGELIARLEQRDVTAQLQQADANVGVARANIGQARAELGDAELALGRARDLKARNFIAQAQVDQAEARALKARAALGSAQAAERAAEAGRLAASVAVGQTEIRAPFDGVVLVKNANVGDLITNLSAAADSKGAVVSMADMSTLEVEADVSESNIARIKPGQPCEIQLDAFPELRFRGEVSRLVPTVDRTKASVMTKIRFLDPDPRVLPEMSAKVAFLAEALSPEQRKARTAVHGEAVVQADGVAAVFRVADGVATRVAVKTGAKIGDLVEVSGVKPGERLVLRPPASLRDGAAVSAGK
ncbi:efflux RND transporter periplasmic adaptor subunit [Zoogloea sp. 1C4]|uniref:efflux RND transporter periplasmic adaptor subunit n=1 Tax=Zoogloea sp. 1C4 TaxID=2570190 RepID=UPI001290F4CC|nr:efflux RND transporter periplasmic adaptor subunit [Zoogloea sp. 1C4]